MVRFRWAHDGKTEKSDMAENHVSKIIKDILGKYILV